MHNPVAEARRAQGCSFKEFLDCMLVDDALDAPLTNLGIWQADRTRDVLAERRNVSTVDLVLSSPLSRAIDTACIIFPQVKEKQINLHCLENLRERNGWMLNAKRRNRSELEQMYPFGDFSDLKSNEDDSWADNYLETKWNSAIRAYKCLQYIWELPHKNIAVVAHGGIFHDLLSSDLLDVEDSISKRFENAELRSCSLMETEGRFRLFPHVDIDFKTLSHTFPPPG